MLSMLSSKTKRILFFVSTFFIVSCLLFLILLVRSVIGVETQTTNLSEVQISHAREFLYINPELDVEPIAYYIKEGMDYQVMFKFIAITNDPAQIFDNTQVDPTEFKANYVFKPGEKSLNKNWWDMASQKLTGEGFWVPKGADRFWKLHIGFFENGNGTLTVYTWRRETGVSERE